MAHLNSPEISGDLVKDTLKDTLKNNFSLKTLLKDTHYTNIFKKVSFRKTAIPQCLKVSLNLIVKSCGHCIDQSECHEVPNLMSK